MIPAQPCPHLHYTIGPLHPLDVVVGHADCFGQSLLVAFDQALAECIIGPGVQNWEARPVNLIQVHALLVQSIQTGLHQRTQFLNSSSKNIVVLVGGRNLLTLSKRGIILFLQNFTPFLDQKRTESCASAKLTSVLLQTTAVLLN